MSYKKIFHHRAHRVFVIVYGTQQSTQSSSSSVISVSSVVNI